MKEGDVVVGRLVPTDQNTPEAVQPTVSAFHHPAAGFEPSFPFDGLSLFASTPDVGGAAELVQGAAYLSEVVAPCPRTDPGDALGKVPGAAPAGGPP